MCDGEVLAECYLCSEYPFLGPFSLILFLGPSAKSNSRTRVIMRRRIAVVDWMVIFRGLES